MRRGDYFAVTLLAVVVIVTACVMYFAAARMHEAESRFDRMIADRRCLAYAAVHHATIHTTRPCVVVTPDGVVHTAP